MLAADRHRHIMELIERDGSVDRARLQADLPVTAMTLWRDLAELESAGRLRRVHGGAVRPGARTELAFRAKERRSMEEKRAIAQRAVAEFVRDGDVVILEGGTTVAEVLPCLTRPRFTVLTNSVPILARAWSSHRSLAIQGSGGVVSGLSGNLVGEEAVAFFARRRAAVFFMSATGLDLEEGRLTDPNPIEIQVKRAMAQSAARVVLLLDATKLGALSAEEVMPLREIDAVVTDVRATQAQRRQLKKLFARAIIV
jgi:DeoR/GlpR family transcriptional regulator of sugar metabolism